VWCAGGGGFTAFDPRTARGYAVDTFYSDPFNQFLGPDGRRYIWANIADRNTWMIADVDRNTATYVAMYNYTTDVIQEKDDGNYGGAAFSDVLQLKYYADYFNASETIQ
jgi:hypothetical protein